MRLAGTYWRHRGRRACSGSRDGFHTASCKPRRHTLLLRNSPRDNPLVRQRFGEVRPGQTPQSRQLSAGHFSDRERLPAGGSGDRTNEDSSASFDSVSGGNFQEIDDGAVSIRNGAPFRKRLLAPGRFFTSFQRLSPSRHASTQRTCHSLCDGKHPASRRIVHDIGKYERGR